MWVGPEFLRVSESLRVSGGWGGLVGHRLGVWGAGRLGKEVFREPPLGRKAQEAM